MCVYCRDYIMMCSVGIYISLEWVNDAVNDILHGKAQMQAQEQVDDHGERYQHASIMGY